MEQSLQTTYTLQEISHIADKHAHATTFSNYTDRKANNTLRRRADDIQSFCTYLNMVNVHILPDQLLNSPSTWKDVTHGIVAGFVGYLVQSGYSIATINARLSTIKVYCSLSTQSGYLAMDELAKIKLVKGYQYSEGKHLDETREVSRVGAKKEEAVSINKEQAEQLKAQPETPQGYRDSLLMCLLLDHGLRCGEVEGLNVESINLDTGILTFYREKVQKTQTHELTRDTLLAARKYLNACNPSDKLLMGSRRGGKLEGAMSNRAITERVRELGERIGLNGLSAHDCRHYWATSAIKGGTDIKSLETAGGWSSPAMPLRYAEASKVANKGVKLG